jgi:hypothetical protein
MQPITTICMSDGSLTDHTTPCPCGNTAGPGRGGCAHSFDPQGTILDAAGSSAVDDVVLHAEFMPASSYTLFIQHCTRDDRVFFDGVICAGGMLTRLRGRSAIAGEAFFPNSNFPSDAVSLSQRGGVFPGQGVRRYYAAWYRNASTTFCPPATANVTNGIQVDW